jgi:hypothetical protein
VGIRNAVRWSVALALLLSVATASSRATDTNPPPERREERPSTVVVRVSDDGFHWADAGLGAAAGLATTLLGLGLVLARRPDRGASGKPRGALVSGKESQ